MLEKEKHLLSCIFNNPHIKELAKKYSFVPQDTYRLIILNKEQYINLIDQAEIYTMLYHGTRIYRIPNSLMFVFKYYGKFYSINFDKYEKENT